MSNDKLLIHKALYDTSKEKSESNQSKENSKQTFEKKKERNFITLKPKKHNHPYRSKITIEKLNKYSIFDTCNNFYSTSSNTNKGESFTLRNATRYLTLSDSQNTK